MKTYVLNEVEYLWMGASCNKKIKLVLKALFISESLMIKAVLLSRLAMTQDSIRNTHTQMLWEKGFRGETLPVLVTKYGQNVIPKTHVTLH